MQRRAAAKYLGMADSMKVPRCSCDESRNLRWAISQALYALGDSDVAGSESVQIAGRVLRGALRDKPAPKVERRAR